MMNKRIPSPIFNMFKYGIVPHLEKLEFNLQPYKHGVGSHRYSQAVEYLKVTDNYSLNFMVEGNYEDVLDMRDECPFAKLFGRSDEKQFVPELFTFTLITHVFDKETKGEVPTKKVGMNFNFTSEFILDKVDDIEDYLDDVIAQLFEELHQQYPENKFGFRSEHKNVYVHPLKNTRWK